MCDRASSACGLRPGPMLAAMDGALDDSGVLERRSDLDDWGVNLRGDGAGMGGVGTGPGGGGMGRI
jgi:hypothetical protein